MIRYGKVGSPDKEITARNIIIATRLVPFVPKGIEVDGKSVFTSDHALKLESVKVAPSPALSPTCNSDACPVASSSPLEPRSSPNHIGVQGLQGVECTNIQCRCHFSSTGGSPRSSKLMQSRAGGLALGNRCLVRTHTKHCIHAAQIQHTSGFPKDWQGEQNLKAVFEGPFLQRYDKEL
ncbi:hypothetical protein ACP4OV_012675 [Aristida adscensionis]